MLIYNNWFCLSWKEFFNQSSTPSKSVTDFHLPKPTEETIRLLQNRLILEETSYDTDTLKLDHQRMLSQLNSEQLHIYKLVVSSEKDGQQVLLFIYGHGGTGKTFLWTT